MAAALRRMSVVASDQTHRIRLAFSGGNVKATAGLRPRHRLGPAPETHALHVYERLAAFVQRADAQRFAHPHPGRLHRAWRVVWPSGDRVVWRSRPSIARGLLGRRPDGAARARLDLPRSRPDSARPGGARGHYRAPRRAPGLPRHGAIPLDLTAHR